MNTLYSRTVTVRTPNGLRSQLVTHDAFLSRSLACFMALDMLAQWHARSTMSIDSVSELTVKTVEQTERAHV